MKTKFNYFLKTTTSILEEIEVEDAGNFSLLANTDTNAKFYLQVKTNGQALSSFIRISPTKDGSKLEMGNLEFNLNKVSALVKKVLETKDVTQVTVIDSDTFDLALEDCLAQYR